jgi:hypothetical protein
MFRVEFGFWGVFFEAMNEFVMVFRVFWVKNGLQKRFLGQKSIGPDFLFGSKDRQNILSFICLDDLF